MEFCQRKTHGVRVVQDVSAMLVVIAVRNATANFVQLCGPIELAYAASSLLSHARGVGLHQLPKQACGHLAHACPMRAINAKLARQTGHRFDAQVATELGVPLQF